MLGPAFQAQDWVGLRYESLTTADKAARRQVWGWAAMWMLWYSVAACRPTLVVRDVFVAVRVVVVVVIVPKGV